MNKKYIYGITLIILGVLGIVDKIFNLNLFSISTLWPFFLIVPGLFFEGIYYSSKKSQWVLVPGGILTVLGFLFLFENLTYWRFAIYTWPIYILAVAVGLLQYYLCASKPRKLLIPIIILFLVAILAYCAIFLGTAFKWMNISIVIPVILIVIGVYLLVGNKKVED